MLDYLTAAMPDFVAILDPTPNELSQITERFQKRADFFQRNKNSENELEVGASLVEMTWYALKKNIHAIQFLKFINEKCKSIRNRVEPKKRNKLRNTLFQMIVNFDNSESRYLDYIGEVCVLAKILSNENLNLTDVEAKMPNGKSLDFRFDGDIKPTLVEVSNIHMDVGKISSEEDLLQFIAVRTQKKVLEKFKGIPDDGENNIHLVQVLWGKVLDLHQYIDCFRKINRNSHLLSPLMMVAQLFDPTENLPKYEFITVVEYLEKYLAYKSNPPSSLA